MRRLFWLALTLLPALAACEPEFAWAQYAVGAPTGYVVVSACGSQTLTAGHISAPSIDVTGLICDITAGGTVTANNNITQWNGVTVALGAGATSSGTLRVVIASDQDPATATNQSNVIGTASPPGTAAANALLIGGIFTSGGVTITDGQQSALQMTAAGALLGDLAQVNGITVLTGTGATGTGAQRVTVARDVTTLAGAAPGTAGSPSANVVSVQGVSSGTTIPVTGNVTQWNGVTTALGAGNSNTGTLRTVLATDQAPVSVNVVGYSFANITTKTTTLVKSGAGTFHSVTINTVGITNTATVYDGLDAMGTKIATIDTTGGLSTITFDAIFSTGLTVVTAGGTAADITVTYR